MHRKVLFYADSLDTLLYVARSHVKYYVISYHRCQARHDSAGNSILSSYYRAIRTTPPHTQGLLKIPFGRGVENRHTHSPKGAGVAKNRSDSPVCASHLRVPSEMASRHVFAKNTLLNSLFSTVRSSIGVEVPTQTARSCRFPQILAPNQMHYRTSVHKQIAHLVEGRFG